MAEIKWDSIDDMTEYDFRWALVEALREIAEQLAEFNLAVKNKSSAE